MVTDPACNVSMTKTPKVPSLLVVRFSLTHPTQSAPVVPLVAGNGEMFGGGATCSTPWYLPNIGPVGKTMGAASAVAAPPTSVTARAVPASLGYVLTVTSRFGTGPPE